MPLAGKTALVFAANGDVGSAVSRRLAQEGATAYLSGRDEEAVRRLAEEIIANGGTAHAASVDACDDRAVTGYVDRVAQEAGPIDVVFNAIGLRPDEAGYATPAPDLPREKFLLPLRVIVGSQFLTAGAAIRHMRPQGSSIVMLSATLSAHMVPFMAGSSAACGAIEAMTRSLAAEFGPLGVRVNCVRAGGMVETRTIRDTTRRFHLARGHDPEDAEPPSFEDHALRRPTTLEETAAVVAYLASDLASAIAGQVITVDGGQTT